MKAIIGTEEILYLFDFFVASRQWGKKKMNIEVACFVNSLDAIR